jgi:sec-independent protein translocase protein TatB
MFGLGWGEILFIAVIAMILVGPNKLPGAAAQAAKWINEFRQLLENAKNDVVRSAGIDESTLSSISDLHPKKLASSLLAGESLGLNDDPTPSTPNRVVPNVTSAPRSAGGLDPDAT